MHMNNAATSPVLPRPPTVGVEEAAQTAGAQRGAGTRGSAAGGGAAVGCDGRPRAAVTICI